MDSAVNHRAGGLNGSTVLCNSLILLLQPQYTKKNDAASSLYEQVTVLEYRDTVSQCSAAVTPAVDLTLFLMCCCTDEFEAHTSSVSCSALGKSSGRLLATGGEDCRVNLWAVSKANCIMVRQLSVT